MQELIPFNPDAYKLSHAVYFKKCPNIKVVIGETMNTYHVQYKHADHTIDIEFSMFDGETYIGNLRWFYPDGKTYVMEDHARKMEANKALGLLQDACYG